MSRPSTRRREEDVDVNGAPVPMGEVLPQELFREVMLKMDVFDAHRFGLTTRENMRLLKSEKQKTSSEAYKRWCGEFEYQVQERVDEALEDVDEEWRLLYSQAGIEAILTNDINSRIERFFRGISYQGCSLYDFAARILHELEQLEAPYLDRCEQCNLKFPRDLDPPFSFQARLCDHCME